MIRQSTGMDRKSKVRLFLKGSYKSTLMGESSSKEHEVVMEEDFNLADGDVIIEIQDGVPLIIFSSRVQQLSERHIARTIIIKMLGGWIGFSVLLNKIKIL